ncbi:DUF4279 domain-containing protein [Oceanobacillus manasiensis]|uniref:DUF4279 domain-containing protein n=1 Tax=Oceanobacillus manasiensis TaxID=586413 RepID=UPI000694D01E|nr:DUF4279 domain-containing protein [Oceanobacillus manasiensis]
MSENTLVEVYLDFKKDIYLESIDYEPDWDFSLQTVTNRLGISPTKTRKVGEWMNSIRRSDLTQWKYSTGKIETLDFEMALNKVVDTFKDKVDIINELKKELGLRTSFCAVTHVYEGISPGYSFPLNIMKFLVSIDTEPEIDEYVYGFVEEDIED